MMAANASSRAWAAVLPPETISITVASNLLAIVSSMGPHAVWRLSWAKVLFRRFFFFLAATCFIASPAPAPRRHQRVGTIMLVHPQEPQIGSVSPAPVHRWPP